MRLSPTVPPPTETGASVDTLNLVVARYLDGRVLKGTTRDFSPVRPSFHIEVGSTHEIVELRMRQLKAVFFVKSFDGDPARENVQGFMDGPMEKAQGRKLAVRFRDGEFMCGYTMSWSPDREGFFIFPADPGSNNDRVYVVSSSAEEIKAGPQAEVLARKVLLGQGASGPSGPRPGGAGQALGARPPLPGTRPRTDAA